MTMDADKLKKLQNKFGNVRTGGKGSVRRKRKAVRKTAGQDDKRLKSTLNRLGVRDIPAIEEVNLFKDDGSVIHFTNPRVQASLAANTYVVSGNAEQKKLSDMLPQVLSQLPGQGMEQLQALLAQMQAQGVGAGDADVEEDEDVPDLVEDFEAAAEDAE